VIFFHPHLPSFCGELAIAVCVVLNPNRYWAPQIAETAFRFISGGVEATVDTVEPSEPFKFQWHIWTRMVLTSTVITRRTWCVITAEENTSNWDGTPNRRPQSPSTGKARVYGIGSNRGSVSYVWASSLSLLSNGLSHSS